MCISDNVFINKYEVRPNPVKNGYNLQGYLAYDL
jgi:hypothetical protein